MMILPELSRLDSEYYLWSEWLLSSANKYFEHHFQRSVFKLH